MIVALALYTTDLTGSAADVGLVLAAHAIPLISAALLLRVRPRAREVVARTSVFSELREG